jgi:hypothetical protein
MRWIPQANAGNAARKEIRPSPQEDGAEEGWLGAGLKRAKEWAREKRERAEEWAREKRERAKK